MRALVAAASLCALLGCSAASTTTGASSARSSGKGSSSKGGGGSSGHGSSVDAGPDGGSGSSGAGGSSSGAGSTGSTTSAAGTSVAGGGSSSGASSSAAGGGDAGLFVCGDDDNLPDGGGCPNGSFVAQAVDLFTCAPIAGATVQALDANAVPQPATAATGADGTFVLCGPEGSAFTPSVAASSYATLYFEELQAGTYNSLAYMPVVSLSFQSLLGELLPGGANPSLGMITANVANSPSCPDASGWIVSLSYADGGAIPDGGYLEAYLSPSGPPQPGATATTSGGDAVFYNIDLSATNYFSVTATNPDAGHCPLIPDGVFSTGRVYVQGGAVSLRVFQIR